MAFFSFHETSVYSEIFERVCGNNFSASSVFECPYHHFIFVVRLLQPMLVHSISMALTNGQLSETKDFRARLSLLHILSKFQYSCLLYHSWNQTDLESLFSDKMSRVLVHHGRHWGQQLNSDTKQIINSINYYSLTSWYLSHGYCLLPIQRGEFLPGRI